MKKIVLFGVKGSGKDTLADALRDADRRWMRAAFADRLKAASDEMFGFKYEDHYGPSERRDTLYEDYPYSGWCFACHRFSEPTGAESPSIQYYQCSQCIRHYPSHMTPRCADQTLGTEFGRRCYVDLWAVRTMKHIDSMEQSYGGAIVSDGRFRTELQASLRAGATTVLLLRGIAESTDPHPSEAEVREMSADPLWRSEFQLVFDNRQGSKEENVARFLELVKNTHPEMYQCVVAS